MQRRVNKITRTFVHYLNRAVIEKNVSLRNKKNCRINGNNINYYNTKTQKWFEWHFGAMLYMCIGASVECIEKHKHTHAPHIRAIRTAKWIMHVMQLCMCIARTLQMLTCVKTTAMCMQIMYSFHQKSNSDAKSKQCKYCTQFVIRI